VSLTAASQTPPTTPVDLPVDIIINNYNYGRFLAEAIDSALSQTYHKVNVIVVDDGSTDRSRQVLQDYQGRAAVIFKENGGQASALNSGFSQSTGEVIIFLDADDLLKPEAASLAATAFAADPRVVKVQYRLEVIDEQGRSTGVVKPARHLRLPEGDLARAELTFPFDLVWTRVNAFRAQALRRIFPIPEQRFANCADWYAVHLTPLLGSVVSLQDLAACYRVHGHNRYELAAPTLDLKYVRQTVEYASVTTFALEQLAGELDLERPERILSISDLSNRLVSLRLEPEKHPLRRDRRWRLALDGIRAAFRRFDVSWPIRATFIFWFILAASAPRSLLRGLAQIFFFPQRRERLNRLIGHFQRESADWPLPSESD